MTIACNKVYVLELAEEEEVPVFCAVKYMLCIRENWLLCCRVIVPEKSERCYHAVVYGNSSANIDKLQRLPSNNHSTCQNFSLLQSS